MTRRTRTTLIALMAVAFVLLVGIGVPAWLMRGDHQHSGVEIGGPFTLMDGNGKTVTQADFLGRYMLLYFGYTFCPDACPTSLSLMAAALDKMPADEAKKIVPVFITIDPERDTAKVVKDYAAAFYPRMVGLTGSPEQISAVERNYKVYAAKVPNGDGPYSMDHSSIIYLVGPDGNFMVHFSHSVTADQMAEELHKRISP